MKLLYEQYKLVEMDSRQVGRIWKGFQITTFILAATFSIICEALFYSILNIFNTTELLYCILYPKSIYFLNNTQVLGIPEPVPRNASIHIDFIKSQFSEVDVCYFPIFNPIVSVIFSIVWITLFTMCPRGGSTISGLKKPWRIVVPAFTFCSIYSILCLLVSSNFQSGMNAFLKVLSNATELQTVPTKDLEILNIVYHESTISVICSWLYSICWVIASLILVLRCFLGADFHYVHVKVEILEVPKSDSDPSRNIINTAQTSELPSPQFSDAISTSLIEPIDAQKKEDLDIKQGTSEKTNEIFTPALIHSE